MRKAITFFVFSCIVLLVFGCSQKPEKRSFVIARSMMWRSLHMGGMEKNVIGFSDDLLFAIGEMEGVKFSIVEADTRQMLALLDHPKIDAVLVGIEPTEEISRLYSFSNSYFTLGTVLVVRNDSPIKSYNEMTGKDVGFLKTDLQLFQQKNNVLPNVRPYDDLSMALEELSRGALDGVVVDAFLASKYLYGLYKGKFRIVGEALHPFGLRVVVKKGKNETLITFFNEGLKKLHDSGAYTKILAYWNLVQVS